MTFDGDPAVHDAAVALSYGVDPIRMLSLAEDDWLVVTAVVRRLAAMKKG